MMKALEDQRKLGFPGLTGSSVRFDFAISDTLIDEVAKEAIVGRDVPIEIRSIEVKSGAIECLISHQFGIFVPKSFRFALPPQIGFPDDCCLRLTMVDQSLSGAILRMMASFLITDKSITITGNELSIDLRQVLAGRGLEDLIAFLSPVALSAGDGKVLVSGTMQVDSK
jgi:hypothetical protein